MSEKYPILNIIKTMKEVSLWETNIFATCFIVV